MVRQLGSSTQCIFVLKIMYRITLLRDWGIGTNGALRKGCGPMTMRYERLESIFKNRESLGIEN